MRLAIKASFGEIDLEGDTVADVRSVLRDVGISEENANEFMDQVKEKLLAISSPSRASEQTASTELLGVIEFGSDGIPHITVAATRLTAKEAIGLLLYAKGQDLVSMGQLTKLVADNWKNVGMPYVAANMGYMKPLLIKEGSRGSYSYRLSGQGRLWIQDEVLPKLKGNLSSE